MAEIRQTGQQAGQQAGQASIPIQRGQRAEAEATGWVGWVFFAGIMMVLLGAFHAVAGLAALFNDDWFLVTASGLIVSANYTAWGWMHLLLGVLVGAAGFGVMMGQTWARLVGIIVAGLSAIVSLGFLAAYPIWSVLLITLDVIVIYALAVHGKEVMSYAD